MGRLSQMMHAVKVLSRADLVRFSDPLRTVRSMRVARRWGPLVGALDTALREDRDRAAVVDERGVLTFGELGSASNALARAWAQRGVTESDVVAVLCRDHRWAVYALFAAAKLGCTLVPMHTGFSGPQLAEVVAREHVSVLVYDEEFVGVVRDVNVSVWTFLGWTDEPRRGTVGELIEGSDGAPLAPPAKIGGIVLLTSGTTGAPKGTPRNTRSPLVSTQLLDRIPLRPRETTFIGAPIFHATGFAHFALCIALRSTAVLRRRFDARETIRAVVDNRCTAVILVPTMLRRILDLDDLGEHELSALRILFCAGSALPTELGNRAMAVFGDVLHNLYGSTEVAVATVATPDDWRAAPGTVGKCPVGCRVRLCDERGKLVRGPHVEGRIFVSNGLRFAGYTDGGTREVIDGMVSTGDVGIFDTEGRLFVVGRADDMVVSGGENVYPAEVEDLLAAHECIVEAAVLGVPDEEFGARLCAYVVTVTGARVGAEDVIAHVRANLARHKVPRDVVFSAALPRNAAGKVLKRELGADDQKTTP